jgi:hypothetical protein
MRLLVTGGPDFADRDFLFAILDRLHGAYGFTLVIHGNAAGTDHLAGRWARRCGMEVLTCTAPSRVNGTQWMLQHSPNLVIAFPGSKDTRDMVRLAEIGPVRREGVTPGKDCRAARLGNVLPLGFRQQAVSRAASRFDCGIPYAATRILCVPDAVARIQVLAQAELIGKRYAVEP